MLLSRVVRICTKKPLDIRQTAYIATQTTRSYTRINGKDNCALCIMHFALLIVLCFFLESRLTYVVGRSSDLFALGAFPSELTSDSDLFLPKSAITHYKLHITNCFKLTAAGLFGTCTRFPFMSCTITARQPTRLFTYISALRQVLTSKSVQRYYFLRECTTEKCCHIILVPIYIFAAYGHVCCIIRVFFVILQAHYHAQFRE